MAEPSTNESVNTEIDTEVKGTETEGKAPEVDNADVAKLRAELAKQKAAFDKAAKEASDFKKQLRAKQSAEEVAAEEAKALQESMREELETLRKEKAVASATAKVVTFVGDNEVASKIAEYLYGAEDVDAALTEIAKAWTAKEKSLRLELGKMPPPGVGSGDGPTITKAELDKMTYIQRAEFAAKHPDEYEHLMGRK